MSCIHRQHQCSLRPALAFVFILALFLFAPPSTAAAGDSLVVNSIAVNKETVSPGDEVLITVDWINPGSDVEAQVRCEGQSKTLIRNIFLTAGAGRADVDFDIDWSVPPGEYSVKVRVVSADYESSDGVFTVEKAARATITSPTASLKATKSPGDTLTVGYSYDANHDTGVYVRLSESKINGAVVASNTVTLRQGSRSDYTQLKILSTAAYGNYDLTVVAADNDQLLANQKQAVILEPKLEAVIKSPSRTSPASVLPGDRITVTYTYEVFETTTADIRLLKSGGSPVASATVTLSKGEGSGSATLTIPEKTALGKYDLEIRAGNRSLHTQKEAVAVEHRITADITSPTRSKSVSVTGGEKVTIDFKYTASDKTSVNVKLQNGDVLVERTVSLEKTTRSTSGSVTLTIPKDADPGKYDVVIENPISGKTLDTEQNAVSVEPKITASITSPTKSKPSTVRAGDSLRVEFEYTSNADAEVEIKVVGAGDAVLASRTASIDETSSKKSKTVSVNIPSRTVVGVFDVTISTKQTDNVLATQEQAVSVEDPVKLNIESPTTLAPAAFNVGDQLHVELSYTAEVDSSIQLNLLKPDGKTLVSSTISLPKTSRARTETVTINTAGATPMGSYDLQVVNRSTGNELALEKQAVQAVTYPLGVQVRLVIGQAGRWVNGTYQSVDLAPRIIENRTLLPIRHVGEPLGWRFTWDGETKLATVIKGKTHVRVRVNDANAQVSGDNGLTWRTERIDPENPSVQPVLMSGRVLLPLRFVSEKLDTQVDWNAATQAVTVTQG